MYIREIVAKSWSQDPLLYDNTNNLYGMEAKLSCYDNSSKYYEEQGYNYYDGTYTGNCIIMFIQSKHFVQSNLYNHNIALVYHKTKTNI